MHIEFTPEQQQQLQQLASERGIAPSLLVRNITLDWLQHKLHFSAFIQEGIDQADRGELIESEQMDAIFERLLRG